MTIARDIAAGTTDEPTLFAANEVGGRGVGKHFLFGNDAIGSILDQANTPAVAARETLFSHGNALQELIDAIAGTTNETNQSEA